MKALSIKQPWANLILSGEKTIETRVWSTSFRGDFIICSSKIPNIYPCGVMLAVAELYDCKKMTLNDEKLALCSIYPRANSFYLRNIRPIKQKPISGKLGFFELDEQI